MSIIAVMKDVFQMFSRKLYTYTVRESKQTWLSLFQANYAFQVILDGDQGGPAHVEPAASLRRGARLWKLIWQQANEILNFEITHL